MIDHTGPALTSPDHHAWLRLQARGLLDFARKTMVAGRGAGWLTVDGQVDDTQAIHTWITARMVHAFSLGPFLEMRMPGKLRRKDWTRCGPVRCVTASMMGGSHRFR